MKYLCNNRDFSRHLLRFSTCYVILLKEYGKETQGGYLYARNRRILHTRRDSSHSQNYRRLCNQTTQKEQNARVQSRRLLESKQKRILESHGKVEEYSRAQGQIKIAGKLRQISTNDLVATNLLLTAWKTDSNRSSQSYPLFSIDNPYKIVKALLPKSVLKTWVCERKAIPMRPIMRYNGTSTSSPTDLEDMDFYLFLRKEITMSTNTSKQSYDIIRHRRGLLLYDPIQKKYVPNRRGRPKHFVLHKHVQQFLQKRGVA